MIFWRNKYRRKTWTIRLPDGTLAKVDNLPTSEDTYVRHRITPERQDVRVVPEHLHAEISIKPSGLFAVQRGRR